MGAILRTIDQVTPEWLTRALRMNGHLERGKVVAVRFGGQASSATGGPGFRPSHRLELSYSADAPLSAPSRLYLKVGDGAIDKLEGKREVEFYTAIATCMPDSPGLPCYDAAYDRESGDYHLLLKDVSETHFTVEREAPATKPEVETMLDVLARFHAHWWGHPRLGEIGLVDAAFVSGEDSLDFAGFVDYLGDRLSDERRNIYEQVLTSLPGLLEGRVVAKRGLTLAHDDAHVWNFLLPRNAEQDRVYLVDWQQWGVSAGPHDVAYMIGLFWYPERRARMEKALVRHYHERLLEYGVANYDWDTCWHDYRLFAIRNLMVPLWAWTWAQRRGRIWGFHRWMQLEKAMLAFQDLACAELLVD